jgi:hypothetical protein
MVEDSDRVERFYCNETNTARLFRRYLGKLAQEQGSPMKPSSGVVPLRTWQAHGRALDVAATLCLQTPTIKRPLLSFCSLLSDVPESASNQPLASPRRPTSFGSNRLSK